MQLLIHIKQQRLRAKKCRAAWGNDIGDSRFVNADRKFNKWDSWLKVVECFIENEEGK